MRINKIWPWLLRLCRWSANHPCRRFAGVPAHVNAPARMRANAGKDACAPVVDSRYNTLLEPVSRYSVANCTCRKSYSEKLPGLIRFSPRCRVLSDFSQRQQTLRWGGRHPVAGAPYVFNDPSHPDQYVGYEKEIVDALAAAMGAS